MVSPRGTGTNRALPARLALAASALGLLAIIVWRAWVCDDACISFRVGHRAFKLRFRARSD